MSDPRGPRVAARLVAFGRRLGGRTPRPGPRGAGGPERPGAPGPGAAPGRRGRARAAGLGVGLALAGCNGGPNEGVTPSPDRLFFPSGLALDPDLEDRPWLQPPCADDAACATDEGEQCVAGRCLRRSRWLLVVNGNGDRRFNTGTVVPFDLDRFFAEVSGPNVLDVGAKVTPARPCRRIAGKPQTVECTEEPFALAERTVHIGDFGMNLEPWDDQPGDGRALLLTPVRDARAVTWFDVRSSADDIELRCGQPPGGRTCSARHSLKRPFGDPLFPELAREPLHVATTRDPDQPYAIVTHLSDPSLSLIDLEPWTRGQAPELVHAAPLFVIQEAFLDPGGYGIGFRPCDPDDPPNVAARCTPLDGCAPCARPIAYGALRFFRRLNVMMIESFQDVVDSLDDPTKFCASPAELGLPGAVPCGPRSALLERVFPGGLLEESRGLPILAELAFSSTGDELFVVQTSPGALIRVDTSVRVDGEIVDLPAGQVEICPRPLALAMYESGGERLALVSCFPVGQVFIVDLVSMQVVAAATVGTGPHRILVDHARRVAYVSNTLEATISVLELAPDRPARFTEIARLGLQEPFEQ